MQDLQEPTLPAVGHFVFEVYRSGRGGRQHASRFKVRCDAVGLHETEILLLSVVGSETSVKALTAGLRSSAKDQNRIDYSVHVGVVNASRLTQCPDGYRDLPHQARLRLVARSLPGETGRLSAGPAGGNRLATAANGPIHHAAPTRMDSLAERRDEKAGLDGRVDAKRLSSGAVARRQRGAGRAGKRGPSARSFDDPWSNGGFLGREESQQEEIQTLDEYMLEYGPLLGKQAERSLDPLHVPGRDPLPTLTLLRDPFEAQRHVIEAARKALTRQKSILLVGEMGTGKTLMGMATIHAHAGSRPYRALVFCPGQLVNKWEREIRETIPNAEVIQIESWKNLLHLDRTNKPAGVEWYIIARDRAKLGAKWQPAFQDYGKRRRRFSSLSPMRPPSGE